ncbi:MAG: hypothetical protein HQ567_32000 [Candidatus Nealsonbacteria bacterium]|nr:hypothetical protein [Candidatus Nealsonbacteria bacterium]
MLRCDRRALASLSCCTLALGIVLADATGAAGEEPREDFRVENQVFLGDSKTPYCRTTTIFHQGMVYDFLDDPAEIIVLDKQAGRFVLLDTVHKLTTELTIDDVIQFTKRLQQSAENHSDPFVNFLAAPTFYERFDKEADELSLSSSWMTYRLQLLKPKSPAIVAQYREFADCYARLNPMLHPGARPPFARLLVNEAMQRYAAIAQRVHLSLSPKKTFPPTRTIIRSEHELTRQMAKADLDRVTQTRQFMDIFKPVSLEQYRKAREG